MAGNTVTLVGNLTRDPELRFTNTGMGKATLGLAVNRVYNDRQGERQEQTSFFNVVLWAEQAENVAATLHKGDRVIVTGRMEQRSWETEQGEKRSVVEVVADDVGPSLRWATAEINKTERRPGGQGGGQAPAPAPAAAPVGGGGYADDEEPF